MCFFPHPRRLVPVLATAMLATSVHAVGPSDPSPIRTWGEISSTYRQREYVGLDSEASNWLNIGSISASSYIWRPWFATTRGNLSLSLDQSDFSDQPSEESKYVTGNVDLNVFPSSRFPSQLFYGQTRNELDDNLLNRDIETTEFYARQQYRTEDNAHRLRGEFIETTREDPMASDFRGNRILFSSNSQFENNSLGADIQADSIEDRFQPQNSDSYAVTGRHTFTGEDNLSIDNLASTSATENDFASSGNDIETVEFSSLMSWRPGQEKDLSLTGNLRLSEQIFNQFDDQTTPADESSRSDNQVANLNQGLLYQYSDYLLLQQSINLNEIETNNHLTRTYSEAVGFNYTPDRIDVGIGDYGWNFGSSYVHEHGDIETNNISNNRFSHSLDRRRSLDERTQLRSSLTQTLTYSKRSRDFDFRAIDHSFVVSWSQSSNVDQAIVSLQLLDSRSREDDDELFQLANLQFNGVLRFDRYTQLSGSATLQWSRREDGDDKSTDTVANGNLEYLHTRAFDVPRLRFRSRLTLSEQQSETERLAGEIIENDDNDQTWENSLEYLIGRLETSVNMDFIKANGDYDRVFKIQLVRSFGDL